MSDLPKRLRALADKFSEGWHDGIKIDASDIELLADAAAALEVPEQSEPVHQFRAMNCANWYDGHPDSDDGGGPYETRTLFTHPPRREPLTEEQIKKATGAGDEYWASSKLFIVAIAQAVEAAHGITGEKT